MHQTNGLQLALGVRYSPLGRHIIKCNPILTNTCLVKICLIHNSSSR